MSSCFLGTTSNHRVGWQGAQRLSGGHTHKATYMQSTTCKVEFVENISKWGGWLLINYIMFHWWILLHAKVGHYLVSIPFLFSISMDINTRKHCSQKYVGGNRNYVIELSLNPWNSFRIICQICILIHCQSCFLN